MYIRNNKNNFNIKLPTEMIFESILHFITICINIFTDLIKTDSKYNRKPKIIREKCKFEFEFYMKIHF